MLTVSTAAEIEGYILTELIGSGGYGNVYKGVHKRTKRKVAIKIDSWHNGASFREGTILSQLQGGKGIPKLHSYGQTSKFSYLIIELLGQPISHCKKPMTVDLACSIGIEALGTLEFLHSKSFIHRDVKPEQFVYSRNMKYLCLIDYGLAVPYRYQYGHIPFKEDCGKAGTSSFASIGSQLGNRQSRKDDIEGLMYMLIYLVTGSLPWSGFKGLAIAVKWELSLEKKLNSTIEQVCKSCPAQFAQMLVYARSLRYADCPDYTMLRQLLESASDFREKAPVMRFHSDQKRGTRKSRMSKKKSNRKYVRGKSALCQVIEDPDRTVSGVLPEFRNKNIIPYNNNPV